MYLYEKNKEGTYKLKNKIEADNGKRKIIRRIALP